MGPEAFGTHHFRNSLLLLAIIIAAAFFGKFGWDEYQQNRAAQQAPKVKEIFDHIKQMPDAASRQNFVFSNEYESYGGRSFEYRNGEFEIRVQCKSEGYAFSVNWSGLGRGAN